MHLLISFYLLFRFLCSKVRIPGEALKKDQAHNIKQHHTRLASPSILPVLGVPGQRRHEVIEPVLRRGAHRGLLLERVG